jgi:hypothetical protein
MVRHHAADDPNWKCYHKDVATPERVAAMESDVEELKQSLNVELEEIQKVSKIVRTDVEAHPPPQNSMNNPLSIHFQPEDGEKQQYSALIKAELTIRGLQVTGNLINARG